MISKLKFPLKILSFFVIFSLVFLQISNILVLEMRGPNGLYQRIKSFYNVPINTIDTIYIGTSTFDRGISPLTIWEHFGITGYVRASPAQPLLLSYYYLIETLKYQKPKVVVIGASTLYSSNDVDEKEGFLRISVDPMKFSVEKINLIREIVSRSKKQTIISYVFPLLRYHSRWESIKRGDFDNKPSKGMTELRGFMPVYDIPKSKLVTDYFNSATESKEFDKTSSKYLTKIIDTCKDKNIEVILVITPRTDWNISKYLGVKKFAEEENVSLIDFNLPENIKQTNLDFDNDFYNSTHLNSKGALKLSNFIGQYLHDNYHFTNKLEDPAYAQWNKDVTTLKLKLEAGWAGTPIEKDASGSS